LKGVPVAKEGLKPLALLFVLLIIFSILKQPILLITTLFFLLFSLFFFRNPERTAPEVKDALISPADGRVISIEEVEEGEFLGARTKRITIFMSLLDVHVNRAPCDGRVERIEHIDGEFALAFKKAIEKKNERNYIMLKHGEEAILLVQIAGFLARRIVPYIKVGDMVKRGSPIGIICFGSRVDIYLPKGYEPVVELNSKVKAGISLLAKGGQL
jgi:phosphatidylserine decarboxylase